MEPVIGQLGTRHFAENPAFARVREMGREAFPWLLRVLQDADYRERLWARYGEPRAGDPIMDMSRFPQPIPVRFTPPPLSRRVFEEMLESNAIHILNRWRDSNEEPIRSVLRNWSERYSREHHQVPVAAPGTAQSAWLKYLDACQVHDFATVQAYWKALEAETVPTPFNDSQEAADAGIESALAGIEDAAFPEWAPVVEFLLSKGGDIDAELNPNIGHTALHYAAQGDEPEPVAWLLAHGADVNKPSGDGKTAIMFAVSGNGLLGERDLAKRRAVMKLLLDAGADVSYRRDDRGGKLWVPTVWENIDAAGESLLAEFGYVRPQRETIWE